MQIKYIDKLIEDLNNGNRESIIKMIVNGISHTCTTPEIYDEDTDTLFSKISEDIYKLVYPFQVSNQQLHEYYRKQVDDFIHEIKR